MIPRSLFKKRVAHGIMECTDKGGLNMEKEKKYYSVSEIATMFEVSRSAVYKWLRNGLKHKKVKNIGENPRTEITKEAVIEFHKEKEEDCE